MNCTKCGERVFPGPNAIERVRHGEIEFRHRICSRRLKAPKRKNYQLKKPEKRGWTNKRDVALTTKCEISGHQFASIKSRRSTLYVNRVVDHIVPERLAVTTGRDPHVRLNLICTHSNVHGRKRAAEDKLLKSGDVLTYLQELTYQGWPMDRVHRALFFYGIKHSNGICVFCDTALGLQEQKAETPTQHTGESTDGSSGHNRNPYPRRDRPHDTE
jgi:hypothetical protein